MITACFFGFTTILNAQVEAGTTTITAEKADDMQEEPFKTIWEKEFEFSHVSQQAGQNINSLSFTSTFILSESMNFVSAAIAGSRMKVEGVDSNTGTLTLGGGLGLGFFSPSLLFGFEGGENELHEVSSTLSSIFKFTDSFSANLSLGGNSANHQGPVSQFFGTKDLRVEIDTKSWNAALGISYIPWDWFMVSLTSQNEYDITYQIQNIAQTKKLAMNQSDRILSFTLGFDFMPSKEWVIGIAPIAGQEYYPAGSVYSPLAGRTVYFSTPTTQNFVSWNGSISYSFE